MRSAPKDSNHHSVHQSQLESSLRGFPGEDPKKADSNWGWLAHGGCTTRNASIRKCSCRALETIYLFSVASTILTIAVCIPVALGWPQRSAVSLLLLWIPASHWNDYGLLNLIVFLFVCFCFMDIYIYIHIYNNYIFLNLYRFYNVFISIFKHAHSLPMAPGKPKEAHNLFFFSGEHQAARWHHLAPRRAHHFACDLQKIARCTEDIWLNQR